VYIYITLILYLKCIYLIEFQQEQLFLFLNTLHSIIKIMSTQNNKNHLDTLFVFDYFKNIYNCVNIYNAIYY